MLARSSQKIIIGNWKMHKTRAEARSFVMALLPLVKDALNQVRLAVPFTLLQDVSEEAKGSNILVGAQNINDHNEGAFTGEVSARMVIDAGATFVLLGHSERRRLYGETSAVINRKVKIALSERLRPVVCVGESLEEHDAGHAKKTVEDQLEQSLDGLTTEQMQQIVIAYEPVWAIGTNRAATPEIAREMHGFCRDVIAMRWGKETAGSLSILYGGSVKPDNAKDLLDQDHIDGLLVGGASLSVEAFSKIVQFQNLIKLQ